MIHSPARAEEEIAHLELAFGLLSCLLSGCMHSSFKFLVMKQTILAVPEFGCDAIRYLIFYFRAFSHADIAIFSKSCLFL